MNPSLRALLPLLAALGTFLAPSAAAQAYPNKPIRLIVAFAAGGGGDNVVRPLAQKLTESLGVPIIVDNRPGGGGMIGTTIAARAPADGYTLMVSTAATHATGPQLHSRVPFHPLKDFDAITLLVTSPSLLAVSNRSGLRTVKEMVTAARASPGKLTYASGGPGSPPHLATEIFSALAGISMLQVPYKGGGESVPALAAGEIDVHFFGISTAMPYIAGGRFRTIALAAEQRWPDLPTVPTFAESGYPQYRNANWYGLSAPAGTPKDIIARLNQEVRKALTAADFRDRIRLMGSLAGGDSPEDYAAFIRSEYERYGKAIKTLGLRID
jgi:tripartite-type tricarboxylate transporter receptor subunit TctC